MPTKYRWLETGQHYLYQSRDGLLERRGTLCTVLAVPKAGSIGNVLVRFEDGFECVCNAGALRKVK
jgi:hypothetical protein